MLKVKYKLDKNLEKEYLETLFSTKFGNGKNAQNVQNKFENLKKTYPYNIIFYDICFENIVLIKPENIKNLICKIEKRIIEQSKIIFIQTNKNNKIKREFKYKFKEDLYNIFKYSDKFQKHITPFFTKNFSFQTCFYCNREFISSFKKDEKDNLVSTFQLDHFYDKATYPYLALSFYNLIPSCTTCNSSKVKGTENCFIQNCLSPNHKNFNFNKKVKFKLFLANENLQINESDDIEIPLKENYSDEYEKYKTVFKLDERYKTHKKEAFELIEKSRLYPDSKLEEMAKITGQNIEEIRNSIFNIPKDDEDLHKRPLSKLIKDISEELKLI